MKVREVNRPWAKHWRFLVVSNPHCQWHDMFSTVFRTLRPAVEFAKDVSWDYGQKCYIVDLRCEGGPRVILEVTP